MPTPAMYGEYADLSELVDLREAMLEVVRRLGHRHFDEPVQLASGQLSHDFVDGKATCASGPDLALACRAMLAIAAEHGVEFDAVGGLTLGADHLSHGIAILSGRDWFTVRKAPKGRGTNQRIEGHQLAPGDRVMLVDDVVTTGGSIQQAHEAIREAGDGRVVLATTLVDRGDVAAAYFERQGIVYEAVLTYEDLGIEPVGDGPLVASPPS